jgi:hypothetical protein
MPSNWSPKHVADAIRVDTSEFTAAIREYAQFDRRELPVIINAKLGDWAWEAAKVVRWTTAAIVKMSPWSMNGGQVAWWRFVNTVITAGATIKSRRKATESEARQGYVDLSTGKWISRRKTVSTFRNTNERLKAGDYERVSRSIIKRRAATVKSFPAQFLFAALKLGKNVATVGGKNSWKYMGIGTVKATSGSVKPLALFSIPWRARTLENKRHEGDRSRREQGKVAIALTAVERARGIVIEDMQRKTAERYARKAAQLSGRAA